MNRKKSHNYLTVFVDLQAKRVLLAVDEVRRRGGARTGAGAREELARTSWLWRKNPETWTAREGERWEQLKDRPRVMGLAYAMRQALQGAYAATTAVAARSRFTAWIRWVRAEAAERKSGLLEPMRAAADRVDRH